MQNMSELGRTGGLKGGHAAAKKLTRAQRVARAKNAIAARWRGMKTFTVKVPREQYNAVKHVARAHGKTVAQYVGEFFDNVERLLHDPLDTSSQPHR